MYILFAKGDWTFVKMGTIQHLKNSQNKGVPVLDESLCHKAIGRMEV